MLNYPLVASLACDVPSKVIGPFPSATGALRIAKLPYAVFASMCVGGGYDHPQLSTRRIKLELGQANTMPLRAAEAGQFDARCAPCSCAIPHAP